MIDNYNIMKKFGFGFSLKRAIGITKIRQDFARNTGVPTTKGGLERKIGRTFLNLFRKKK